MQGASYARQMSEMIFSHFIYFPTLLHSYVSHTVAGFFENKTPDNLNVLFEYSTFAPNIMLHGSLWTHKLIFTSLSRLIQGNKQSTKAPAMAGHTWELKNLTTDLTVLNINIQELCES